ncbi:MAG: hypothetical protein QOK05_455 [Chloroflexota bacterium]|nr:hypothetical protein [Chloroflexota bacterium]
MQGLVHAASVATVLSSNVPDHQALYRRNQLRALDAILMELETMNLREVAGLPRPLTERLRRLGVVYRDGAPVSEIIDLVFRAQEAYLVQMPTTTTRRRSAA